MKKKYNPSYKDFMIPLAMLIIGALMFLLTLWINNIIFRGILIAVGLMLILYSVARIMRIFLKIFLDQIKGW